ncbi:MAG: zinc ABC transporter substrate-binding protein [Bacilli bacterium]|nr:zinc ABC transporter substrate-binding protein [Bacilli bacterium]
MKKRCGKVLALVLIGIFLCGCDNSKNSTIYTTIYPIEFLTEYMYGTKADVTSIYPDGTDVEEYTLAEKQMENFSKGQVFIYNGTTKERQFAKDLINANRKMKVIDAAYGLKYLYGMEELWLSPSNYLMLATNIKNSLEEQVGTKYTNEEITSKYNELKEKLSILDAELRSAAKSAKAKGKNTLIVSSNVFKFLENYGFEVISLEDYQQNSASLNTLKGQFNSGVYKYILVENTEAVNDLISEMMKDAQAKTVVVNMMNTLTEENRKNNDTYFTIINDFINSIKNIINE